MPSGFRKKARESPPKLPGKRPRNARQGLESSCKICCDNFQTWGRHQDQIGATEGRKTGDQEIISRQTRHTCGKGCSETPCRQDALNANCLLPAAVPGVTNVKVDS